MATSRSSSTSGSIPGTTRAASSASVRSPSFLSRSCAWSASPARCFAPRYCSCCLHVGKRLRVDQLAQLVGAEQLPQQLAVERQRRRPPLGTRRVALVHVGGDVVEQQALRERGGKRGVRLHQSDLATLEPLEHAGQRRQVEPVAQHLAVGLQHDRELRVASRDLEQALRLQPLLPQRRAAVGPAARDQQRARGGLAETRAEQRRASKLRGDQLLQLGRIDQGEVCRRAARRRPGSAGSRRRPTTAHRGRAPARGVCERRSPSPRRRAAGRRTASGRTGASRRSRRESARPRSCDPTAQRAWPGAGRRDSGRRCRRRSRRARIAPSAAPWPCPRASRRARAGRRRSPRPARSCGRCRRPSRRGSRRGPRAPASRSRGRG